MPIYEYQCHKCGARFEEVVKFFNQPKNVKCPACGEEKAVKKVPTFVSELGEGYDPRPGGCCGEG